MEKYENSFHCFIGSIKEFAYLCDDGVDATDRIVVSKDGKLQITVDRPVTEKWLIAHLNDSHFYETEPLKWIYAP